MEAVMEDGRREGGEMAGDETAAGSAEVNEGVEGETATAVASEVGAGDLATVRELALRAHPDVVPELVGGGSVAEIVASLEPARAAYQRIVAATPAAAIVSTVPTVPAGNAPPVAIDPDLLPAAEKIRR